MIMSQLVYPDLLFPVCTIQLLVPLTAFIENPTLAEPRCTVDPNGFRSFGDAINGAPPDVTHLSSADLWGLAAKIGLVCHRVAEYRSDRIALKCGRYAVQLDGLRVFQCDQVSDFLYLQ
jgi:hypothetical protein